MGNSGSHCHLPLKGKAWLAVSPREAICARPCKAAEAYPSRIRKKYAV